MLNIAGSDGDYTIKDLLENTVYSVRVSTRTPAGLSNYTSYTGSVRTQKTVRPSLTVIDERCDK